MDHLQPIVPGLFLLEGQNNGRFPFGHAFLVRGETEVIVDPGCGVRRLRELRKVWKPDVAVVSHSHPDHCSGLWMLEGTKVISPLQHADVFWRLEPLGDRFAAPGELAALWIEMVKEAMHARDAEADEHYGDGQILDFGGITLECMHAPGHTDDHYVFFEPRHGVALTFDMDMTSFGPWYGHRESDIDATLASIRRVADRKPRMLVSSHKGVITDDVAGRLQRYAAVVEKRDAAIVSLLDAPRTVTELVDKAPIFRKHARIPKLLRYWEGNMIQKHLERLQAKGIVTAEGKRWRRT